MNTPRFNSTLKLSRPRSKPADKPANQTPIKKPVNPAFADALAAAKTKQATKPKAGKGNASAQPKQAQKATQQPCKADKRAANRERNERDLARKVEALEKVRAVLYSHSAFRDFKPLQVHIHKLVEQLPELKGVSKKAIRTVMTEHCTDPKYREGITDGCQRYGLDTNEGMT